MYTVVEHFMGGHNIYSVLNQRGEVAAFTLTLWAALLWAARASDQEA